MITGSNLPNTFENKVQGNLIGLGISGNSLGYSDDGVVIENQAFQNIVGTDGDGSNDAAERNVISGLGGSGVVVRDAVNIVSGNFIGTDLNGETARPNGSYGIDVADASAIISDNVISGNLADGIRIAGNGDVINDSAVLWLKGEGDTDDAITGNSAEPTSQGVTFTTGVDGVNQAFQFDTPNGTAAASSDKIVFADDPSLDLTTLTIEGWIKLDAMPSSTPFTILGKGTTGTSQNYGVFVTTSGELRFSNYNNGFQFYSTSGAGISTGQFYHFAVSVDGTTVKLYLDGELLLATPQVAALIPDNGPLVIGSLEPSFSNRLQGVIDEIAIYNTELSETRIAAIHAMNGTGKQSSIVQGNKIGTNADGDAAVGNGAHGIRIQNSNGNLIGLSGTNVISGNTSDGLYVTNGQGNVISGNYIGTDALGTSAIGNFAGISLLSGSSSNLIGGETASEGNVISGNGLHGIVIDGATSTNNVVQNNYVGLDQGGQSPVANSINGIRLANQTSGNIIGGSSTDLGNTIAGNIFNGISIVNAGQNSVLGNHIGIATDGQTAVSNGENGIQIINSSTLVDNNLISGNNVYGISIDGNGSGIAGNATLWLRAENDTTDELGSNDGTAIPGVTYGPGVGGGQAFQLDGSTQYVEVADADALDATTELSVEAWINPTALTGGTSQFYTIASKYNSNTNQISWGLWAKENGQLDFRVSGNGTTANTRIIETTNASIPLDEFSHVAATYDAASGDAKIYLNGVELQTTILQNVSVASIANTNTPVRIGAYTNSPGNITGHFNGLIDEVAIYNDVLSAHQISSIVALAGEGKQNTVVRNNIIGLNEDGDAARPNRTGIWISNSAGNIIADLKTGTTNTVSGNGTYAIEVTGAGSIGNIISGNRIGTNPAGDTAFANPNGIHIIGGSETLVSDNLISGNSGWGIRIADATTNNRVAGNLIGTNLDGDAAISNGLGIQLQSEFNTIGGTTVAERNIISGNTFNGIAVDGGDNNTILGNWIGLDINDTALANGADGIRLDQAATGNTIGGAFGAEANVISSNLGNGITILAASNGNTIIGNLIGTDSGGSTIVAGQNTGIWIEDSANNNIGQDTDSGNTIKGNSSIGIRIAGAAAIGNVIAGNRILDNSGQGVLIENAANGNVVGAVNDGATEATNTIEGNNQGVYISGSGTNNNVVAGNGIKANSGVGVIIEQGAQSNTIGGDSNAERNVISGNATTGVRIEDAGTNSNRVSGNYIGTDITGAVALGNQTGVQIRSGVTNTIVGGSNASERNVISGNSAFGISIEQIGAGNKIQGNYIGTDATGAIAVGNGDAGNSTTANIRLGTNNGIAVVVGTDGDGFNDANEGNVISGGLAAGIRISDSFSDQGNHVIAGNLIGTDATGKLALPNVVGIAIVKTSNNRIGTNNDGVSDGLEANVISGNANAGIAIVDPDTGDAFLADGNIIAGNLIGTDITGLIPLGNGTSGINLTDATNTIIGGADTGERNVIGDNATAGIAIGGTGFSEGTSIKGNYIGVGSDGSTPLGNGTRGISVTSDATNTQIGGGLQGEGNVISGNFESGVAIVSAGAGTKVQGNYIGTDASGDFAIGNAGTTVTSEAGVLISSTNSTVYVGVDGDGIADAGEGNVISGSERHGVRIQGSANPGGTLHIVAGNIIGLDATGSQAVPNEGFGISIVDSSNNLIGTNADGTSDLLERNIISGNLNTGIDLLDSVPNDLTPVVNTTISGNFIGLDVTGTFGIGNTGAGINLRDVFDTMVGGSSVVERNVIGGNTSSGVLVQGSFSAGTIVTGNFIGTNASGGGAIGNNGGVVFVSGAADGWITDNVVSGNFGEEIALTGSSGNKIQGNLIGFDETGTQSLSGGGIGILVNSGSNGNIIGVDGDGAGDANEGNVIAGSPTDRLSAAIQISDADNTRIRGNKIQTNAAGTAGLGAGDGIVVNQGSQGTKIGTDGFGAQNELERNVITSTNASGIILDGAIDTDIAGNLIGIDVTQSSTTAGRTDFGIQVTGSSSNTRIGTNGDESDDEFEANVIGGFEQGIRIDDATGTDLQGNFIGVADNGTTPLGNQKYGIVILSNQDVNIGVQGNNERANTIAYNGYFGIGIDDPAANQIAYGDNYIYGNIGGGIDLNLDNTTANVAGFLDVPTITSAVLDGNILTVAGTAPAGINLYFYLTMPNASGFGQGDQLIAFNAEGSGGDNDPVAGAFSFDFTVSSAVQFASLISVLGVETGTRVTEFSNSQSVGTPTDNGPGSSLPPVIVPPANVSLVDGTPLHQTITFEDLDSTEWTAQVNYGDGTIVAVPVVGQTIELNHLYAGSNDGVPYNVQVTILDNSNQSATVNFTVTVNNEAPTIDFNLFSITSPVAEGSPVTITGTFADTGATDDHEIEIRWGDGTTTTQTINQGDRTFTASHTYQDDTNVNGTPTAVDVYRVEVLVADQTGSQDATPLGLLLAEIQNVAPGNLTTTLSSNSIVEGSSVTLDGSFDDPGRLDSHTLRINWGDGSPTQVVQIPADPLRTTDEVTFSGLSHVYSDDPAVGPDQYEIRVEVVDDDEPLNPAVNLLTVDVVNDVPEVVTVTLTPSSAEIDENGIITVSGTISDAGVDDKTTVEINWGDGQKTTFRLATGVTSFSNIPHRYLDDPSSGTTYTISARAADNDMAAGTFGPATTVDVTVNNVLPVLGTVTITDKSGTVITGPVNEGDTVIVSGSFSDVGTLDTHEVEIDFGDGSLPVDASVDNQNRTFTTTYTFQDDSSGLLITIDDQDTTGTLPSTNVPLTVNNLDPTFTLDPTTNATETSVELLINATDAGALDIQGLQYTWTIYDSANAVVASASNDSSPTIQFNRTLGEIYRIDILVSDDDGGSATLNTLFVGGDNNENLITLTDTSVTVDGTTSTLPGGISDILILGFDSEDVIDASQVTSASGIGASIDGGEGSDIMFGGEGNDVFYMRGGNDSANVEATKSDGTVIPVPVGAGNFEAGNDRYVFSVNSTHTVVDRFGTQNTLDFGATDFGVTFDLTKTTFGNVDSMQDVDPNGFADPTGTHFVDAQGSFSQLIGTDSGDELTAAEGATISAGGGDDMLKVAGLVSASVTTTLSGDDGIDTFINTGAIAGTLEFSGDDGADVVENSGNILDLVFSGGADNDTFMNTGTIGTINFGGDEGADVFENIGDATSITFSGGADGDIFINTGTGSVDLINFGGDDGADIFTNAGTAFDIVFSGGADADIFTNAGTVENKIDFSGDDGADTFNNEGTAVLIDFSGGADSDIFNNNSLGTGTIIFGGDDGADTFNNVGGASLIEFNGDDGADIFNNLGDAGMIDFDGGADADIFNNIGDATNTIDFSGDDGNDLFTNTGTATTVIFTGGADDNAFGNAGTIDTITFTGGADGDVFENVGDVGSLTFGGDDGANSLTNFGTGTIDSLTFTGGADDDVFTNLGSINGTNAGDMIDFTGDDGIDTFNNSGTINVDIVFTGGADDDLFVNEGTVDSMINFGGDDGADILVNEGTATDITFTGGADGDVFINTGNVTSDLVFNGDQDPSDTQTADPSNDADQFLNQGNVNSLTFNGGADGDLLVNEGTVTSGIDFTGDDGADSLNNSGSVAEITFSGGADADVFVNSGAVGDINFGGDEGADAFNNAGTVGELTFGGGADGDLFVNTSDGVGEINFGGDSDLTFDATTGDPILTRILNGDGDDVLQNDGSAIGMINFTGDGGDDLFINNGSDVGGLEFDGGADDDVLVNYGEGIGSIDFTGDDGVDPGLGATSEDTLIIRGSGNGTATVLFTGGFDGDSFQNNATGFASLEFVGGADNDVFQNNAEGISTIIFSGDTGADIFENNGNAVSGITFTGGADNDIFVNDGIGASDLIFDGGGDDDLFINSGSDVSMIDFGGDDGADTFANTGSGVSGIVFSGDDGADVLRNAGEGVTGLVFDGGADDDLLVNESTGINSSGLSFSGDGGADVFVNEAMGVSDLTFTGGADDDGFQNNGMGVSEINFSGDDGADAFVNTGEDVTMVTFGGGADGDTFVNRADGVSELNFGGDVEILTDANGTPILDVSGNLQYQSITTSDDGADTLFNEGDNVTGITFTGGADGDLLNNIGSNVAGIDFQGDDGADTLVNSGNRVEDISFDGGADDDLLQNTGSNVDSIVFGGDDGADSLVNSGIGVGVIDFTGDDGADVLVNRGNDVTSIVFAGGADGDSLRNLGDGFDEINFGGDSEFLESGGEFVLVDGRPVIQPISTGDDGADAFVQDGIGNPGSNVVFTGGADNDLIAWAGIATTASLDAGDGDDYLLVAGEGTLELIGGPGSDYYIFQGNPDASVTVVEEDNLDMDSLDFSAFNGAALSLDLRMTSVQQQTPEFSIRLTNLADLTNATNTSLGLGIENVFGTSGADMIEGNARDNIITGAEFQEATTSPLAGQRAETQWVLLDFDTKTNETGETGEHVYTATERADILRLMQLTYWGPDPASADPANPDPNVADKWFDVQFTENIGGIPAGVTDYVTIYFNETPDFGRPGGEASEIDMGNLNLDGTAVVQVNGLLGGTVTDADADESEEGLVDVGQLKPAATSENFVFLSVKIAAHELAHLMGLRHKDSFGPIGSGVHSPPGVTGFNPIYAGPAGGFETFDHLLTTGASVGSDRFNDLRGLYFGEREAVKLAFAFSDLNSGSSSEFVGNETGSLGGSHDSIATALPLDFVTLAVPNTLQDGLNSEKEFFVEAASVLGSIKLDSLGDAESDYYSFTGRAGELVNIDVSSLALRDNATTTNASDYIDSIVRVYDSSGNLVSYFGGDAVNDDEFESTDSTIIDLLLPANDTYYIEVDTFFRPENPDDPTWVAANARLEELNSVPAGDLTEAEQFQLERLQESLGNTDIGNYQIFVYKFGQANLFDGLDSVDGNGGNDTIVGGVDVGPSIESGFSEGDQLIREVSFEDPFANSWTVSVDYGDDTVATLDVTIEDGTPTFTLDHEFAASGFYTVAVTIENALGQSEQATFNVQVDASPIEAFDDDATTNEDTSVDIDVLFNDTKPAAFGISISDDPTNGVAFFDLTKQLFTYLPNPHFSGDDSFEYTIVSAGGVASTATVNIVVNNLVDFSGRVFNDVNNDGEYDAAVDELITVYDAACR